MFLETDLRKMMWSKTNFDYKLINMYVNKSQVPIVYFWWQKYTTFK